MTRRILPALLALFVWWTPAGADEPSTATKLLFLAAEAGGPEAARVIIEEGAEINRHDEYGLAPLHIAVIMDRIEVVGVLIDAGADLDLNGGQFNFTALHYAAAEGQIKIARLLLENGADANAKAEGGWTPFGIAMISDQLDAMSLIRSYGGQ